MKIFKFAILTATMTFGALSYANTPSDASLAKLAEIMPYTGVFVEAALTPLEIDRERLMYAVSQDATLTDKQRTDAIKVFDEYAQNLIKNFDTPAKKEELKKAYIAAAKQHFTQAEVDAMIAFYGSQVGISALKKESSVYEAYLKSVEQNTTKVIADYKQANDLKMEDSIKRILNK